MAAAAGEARRVLVYGGRGALGSRCVQAFRARNWVIGPCLAGWGGRVRWCLGSRGALRVQPRRADAIKPGPLYIPRHERLRVHSQVYCSGYDCVLTPRPSCPAFALQGGGG